MYGFIKKVFSTVLMVLSCFVCTTILRCISVVIEEVNIAGKSKDKCISCIFYTVLFSIFFTISIRIGVYFIYCKSWIIMKKMSLNMIIATIQKIINHIKWKQ